MKAEYKEGPSPGNGFIVLSEALFPSGPWSVAIQRSSDQYYAGGNNNWIPGFHFIPVQGEPDQDGTLSLSVGPEVVDSLDQQEQYLITLKGEGETLEARLRVSSITYTPGGTRDYTAVSGPAPVTPGTRQPGPQQPSASESAPPVSPPLELTPQGTIEPTSAPGAQPSRSRIFWRWALLALLLLGCLAWYLLDTRPNHGRQEAANPQTSLPAPKELTAEEQVRQFFKRGEVSPREAADLAAKLPRQTTQDQDAVYRLWYFAAENGEPGVLQDYARALDPAHPPFGTIAKNAPEAWRLYEKIQETNPAAAHQSMEILRKWLTDENARGNHDAREWLLQIDQPR